MKKVKMLISRKPGKINIDNFDELKEYITEAVKPYTIGKNGENTSKAAYNRKMLVKLKGELEAGMKEAVSVYNTPLEEVRFLIMQLSAIIDTPIAAIDEYTKSNSIKSKKKLNSSIRAFFEANCAPLGEYAESIIESPAFIEDKWLEAKALTMSTKHAIIEKINLAAKDISSIETTTHSLAPVLLAKYFETLSISDVISFREAIVKAANGRLGGIVRTADEGGGQGEIVLNCSEDTFLRTLDQLKLMNVDFHVKSCTYPTVLHEIKEPYFDSFVALDIETTGSYGAASGDKPAEITEIGAVKVVNGVVTDTFSMLANPGRSITPHVVKLTHITDEMVANKPPVDEVVKKFIEFAGESILVGHSIKASDLPYICKVAAKAGLEFKNEFFDTCDYAARLKDKYGWQKIKLEYLSELFGIKQKEAHRASSDAQANVGVYFALKALKAD
ncbi:MAG: DUF1351 domain-containing protein [Ruminococcaceae bacterium]|nr:DUF1351 domain-containing protein [Oscillospiraceae bacterium]